jgi:hypothetical protein
MMPTLRMRIPSDADQRSEVMAYRDSELMPIAIPR